MSWTIPDQGEGDSNLQSIVFQEYLEALVAGIDGLDCVLSGGVVTGGADMTPAVAKCAVLSNGTMFAVAGADVTIGTADVTNPRLDLIVVNSSGALAVRAGTAGAYIAGVSAPKPPARTANDVILAVVYVPANDTAIATSQIIDMRVMRTRGPICIYKTVAAETTNNTSAAIEALNKANSGVTIPSGLFLSGRVLKVRMGGNMLVNSGTPTLRLVIAYGGTTMFSFISATSIADADRCAWYLTFDIVAQANNDQTMYGNFSLDDLVAARPTPTTGIGNWQTNSTTAEGPPAIAGSAAVDSDAANRKLSVQMTFSVANAANELVVEGATVEII